MKVVEVIEEPRNIQVISPSECLQTLKQPEKLQAPAKALQSKIANPKISYSISAHSTDIRKDSIHEYFKE